ncbi:MAG TPA: proton-conducting transporter membrane subunit [Tepidisphaeraceae bacterium]|nr:proton-conducting transporter membrane subunit [Tepidisphaeraceae bacterium]
MIGPHVIILFTLIPLLAGTLNVALHRWRGAQRVVGTAALAANLALAMAALFTVYRGADEAGGVLVSQMGNWPAPYGITVAVDALSAVMLAVTAAVSFGVYLYALSQLSDRFEGGYFHATYLFLVLGVNWAFVTGDLFNLFVAFEIMLMSSYVLMSAGTTALQMRQTYKYVLLNLFSSMLLVTACGLLYGHLGTLNMAEITHLSMSGQIPARALPAIALLLIVFGSKTAAFPLWYWLPDTYPTMPPAIGGLFAGLLTKVGVYTMMRTFIMMFGADAAVRELVQPIILVSAGGTMFLGVLGAVSSHNVRRILAIHVISQVGYMVLGVGLATELALAATVLYMVQHMIVKSTLFLCCGLIERYAGTDELERLGGLLKRDAWLAALFFIAALSLAGLPPLSGFFGKLLLLVESLRMRGVIGYTLATLAVVTSLLTLLSMLKIWSFAFWSPAPAGVERSPRPLRRGVGLIVIGAMVLLALSVGLGADYYMKVARVAARGVLDPRSYVSAVLGPVVTAPAPEALADAGGEAQP